MVVTQAMMVVAYNIFQLKTRKSIRLECKDLDHTQYHHIRHCIAYTATLEESAASEKHQRIKLPYESSLQVLLVPITSRC
jgi:hypothetical protein